MAPIRAARATPATRPAAAPARAAARATSSPTAGHVLLKGAAQAAPFSFSHPPVDFAAIQAAYASAHDAPAESGPAPHERGLPSPVQAFAVYALLALPAAATIYLAFDDGGFFPDSTAFVAIVTLQALLLRTLLADRPFEGLGAAPGVAIAALAGLATWQLISALWSDSTARALVEYDRTLLYLATLVLFASVGRTPSRLAILVRFLAAAFVVVCLAGLLSRLVPDVVSVSTDYAVERLSFPVTYWNALGLVAALAYVLCLYLTCSTSEPRPVRAAAAGALPVVAATLILTYSRGGILVTIAGVLVLLGFGRPRAWFGGLTVAVPATVVAGASAYGAERLAEADYAQRGVEQGHDVALVVAFCVVAAILLRALLARWVDDPLAARRIEPLRRLGVPRRLAWAGAAAVAAVVALVAGAPGAVERQFDRFAEGDAGPAGSTRERLTDPSNGGRIPQWEAALEGWKAQPMRGNGAGTYQLGFYERRGGGEEMTVTDGHSLYLETLDELGIVGAVLLCVVLVSLVVAFGRGLRGPDRARYGALLGATTAWLFAVALDWHWEMPVTTVWLFAAGGLALARPAATGRPPMASTNRAVLAVGWLVIAVTPFLVMTSSSRIRDAGAAFGRGDCRVAREQALASLDYLSVRAEPYAIVGFCALLDERPRAAVPAMREAVSRDPRSWEYRLGLSAALAAAGADPGAAIREALRRNPRDPLVRRAAEALLAARTPAERAKAGRDVFADIFFSYKLSIQNL